MKIRLLFGFLLTAFAVFAQRGGGGGRGGVNPLIASLKTVTPPAPTGLDQYVQDPNALAVLGKTLFWDMQAGSDGRTACATCHFHAGADHRIQNELSGPDANVNQVLTAQDYPFHKLSNTGNNRSTVLSDKRQVTGSMGVVAKEFVEVEAGSDTDLANSVAFPSAFMPNGVHLRQVTTRNAPSVINVVYNVRNFWDGRASNVFTGATPFGESDTGLHAVVYRDSKLVREAVRIENASLASQAVGPVLSSVEMSWAGQGWRELGRKLLNLAPLARQRVSPADSEIGTMANTSGNGLKPEYSYTALIASAFRPEYYNSRELFEGYTQAENNFGLFWGIAIQAYQSTLIANDSRVDQFLAGNTDALTALEQQGLNKFRAGGSQCINCHNARSSPLRDIQRYVRAQRTGAVRRIQASSGLVCGRLLTIQGWAATMTSASLCLAEHRPAPQEPFKAPALRNVEFAGPYFHNGSQATLDQVLDFYGR